MLTPICVLDFDPTFFQNMCFFGPRKSEKVVREPAKKGTQNVVFPAGKTTPSETENYRTGTPANTIIEGDRDVAVVAASSPAVLASRQGTFADKLG